MSSDIFSWMNSMVGRCAVAGMLIGLMGVCAEHVGRRQRREAAGASVPAGRYGCGNRRFRAFAVLFPHRDLRAVVVTEGIASVPRGSTAIALFLASGQSFAPVIPGLAAAAPPAYDWLPRREQPPNASTIFSMNPYHSLRIRMI